MVLCLWTLDAASESILILLHGSIFLFFLLILSHLSRLVAYILLPFIVGIWHLRAHLYDVAGAFLHTDYVEEFIATARINQHYLRAIHEITPVSCLLYLLACGGFYCLIFCIRRYLPAVILGNATRTWVLAGLYIFLSLLIFPMGIIPN